MSRLTQEKRTVAKPPPAERRAVDTNLRALLDHLGRLLAQEYVDRLHGAATTAAGKETKS